jgi:type-F conjugative transfer system pilin assembly protein TrbC
MKMTPRSKLVGACLLIAACLATMQPAASQNTVERDRIAREEQAASSNDSAAQRKSLMDQAARQAQPAKINIPDARFAAPNTIDPEKIARQFNDIQTPAKRDDETNELMVFVSTSMPKGSLERAARDSRRASGMMVMRGASKGVGPGKWAQSIADMKPMTDNGGEVSLHPDLFERYGIKKVPAMVIAPEAQAGCDDDACREFAVIYGDVSLDYALERLVERKDAIGAIARARLAKLSGELPLNKR